MKSFPITAAVTANRIAKYLNENGIQCKALSESCELEDGSVEINKQIHVSVGSGYASVVRVVGETFFFGKTRFDAKHLITDIHAALKA